MNDNTEERLWLLVVSQIQDAQRLDEAIRKQESNLHKLGDTIYLGVFRASPHSVYEALVQDHALAGAIRWIELPNWVETGT